MRILWTAIIAGWLFLAAEAHADTIYLKDGQSYWGSEVTEQDDTVIVVRPGGALRFPKSDVIRIDRAQISIPRFYSPPGAGDSGVPTAGAGPAADRPAPPATAAQERAPASGQQPTSTGAPSEPPPIAPPPGPAPTVLPPPPPRGPYAPK